MSVQDMQRGRQRAQQRRRREAIARVKAYRAWLKAGSDFRTIPPVPTDHDFKVAREAQR